MLSERNAGRLRRGMTGADLKSGDLPGYGMPDFCGRWRADVKALHSMFKDAHALFIMDLFKQPAAAALFPCMRCSFP